MAILRSMRENKYEERKKYCDRSGKGKNKTNDYALLAKIFEIQRISNLKLVKIRCISSRNK